MSILDDAIREHLELKRAHGADDAEIQKLEDEAFGPPGRPDDADPFAEAPTEFLTAPGGDEEEVAAEAEPSARRVPNIADLQEAPEPAAAPEEEADEPPSEEEHPAGEHEAIVEPADESELSAQPDGVHTTEEREAIADQPTELFDVQAEIEAEPPAASPSDEELLEAELAEPRLAPVDPISGIEASSTQPDAIEDVEDEEDDFFSEQRLSDELDRALEAPITDEHPVAPVEEDDDPLPPLPPQTEESTALYDIESAEDGAPVAEPDSGEHKAAEPEDVLESTPDFLEDAPEDDELWFEQKPPKDFDFDD